MSNKVKFLKNICTVSLFHYLCIYSVEGLSYAMDMDVCRHPFLKNSSTTLFFVFDDNFFLSNDIMWFCFALE